MEAAAAIASNAARIAAEAAAADAAEAIRRDDRTREADRLASHNRALAVAAADAVRITAARAECRTRCLAANAVDTAAVPMPHVLLPRKPLLPMPPLLLKTRPLPLTLPCGTRLIALTSFVVTLSPYGTTSPVYRMMLPLLLRTCSPIGRPSS